MRLGEERSRFDGAGTKEASFQNVLGMYEDDYFSRSRRLEEFKSIFCREIEGGSGVSL